MAYGFLTKHLPKFDLILSVSVTWVIDNLLFIRANPKEEKGYVLWHESYCPQI